MDGPKSICDFLEVSYFHGAVHKKESPRNNIGGVQSGIRKYICPDCVNWVGWKASAFRA